MPPEACDAGGPGLYGHDIFQLDGFDIPELESGDKDLEVQLSHSGDRHLHIDQGFGPGGAKDQQG